MYKPTSESLNRKLITLGLHPKNGKVDASHLPSVRVDKILYDDVLAWCELQFRDNWIWSAPIQTGYVDIFFKNKESVTLFKLKFNTLNTT